MSDRPEQAHNNSPERPPYRPTLAIFLIMPIAAALVAFLLAERLVEGRDQIGGRRDDSPPIVALTPYTLIGSPAPDFELPTPNGETLRLSALRGQWVVVNFWATWCAPCRAEMPVLQALIDSPPEAARALGQVALIAVNRDESAAAVRAFLDELNLTLPVALDAGGKISNRYGIVSLPITFFIDPEGIVRHKQIGEVTAAILEQTLRKLADS